MKNPVRIAHRGLNNPHNIVGSKLRHHRENADMTQWELANSLVEILDTKSLLQRHLQALAQTEAPTSLDAAELEFVYSQFQGLVALCVRVRQTLDQSQQLWAEQAIAQLLNVEQLVGNQVRCLRQKAGLTQDQLSLAIDKVLGEIGLSGPPNRAGVSKCERAERRIDLLEACAIAISLKIELEELLPPQLAVLLPRQQDRMRGWHPFTIWGNCRQYSHDLHQGVITIASEQGAELPLQAIAMTGV